jgi:hypothetical protein
MDRGHFRIWGAIAALGGLVYWFGRTRRAKRINLHSLGVVSNQWFSDHRHEL